MPIASAAKNVEVPLVNDKEKDNICEEADLVHIQVLQ